MNTKELKQRAKNPVASKGGGKTLADFFDANRQAIQAALPKHMTADRMMRVAMHAVRTTPALQQCTVESLFGAVVQCSQMGLEPNTVLGHAYLVPFNNRSKDCKDVQLIIGYKGLVDLARRSGQIETLSAHVAHRSEYDNGNFQVRYGTEGSIIHYPELEPTGGIVGAYAVATFKGGGYQFEFMTVGQINAIRDASQGYRSAQRYDKDHPWISSYSEMAKKTVIRRLAKYLPLSVELATAAELDGMAEGGKDQGLDTVLDGDYSVMPDEQPQEEPEQQPEEPEPTPDDWTAEYDTADEPTGAEGAF